MLSHLQKYTPTPNTYTYNSLLRLCSQTSTGLKVKLTALMFIPLEFFSVVNLKETCPQQETFFSRSCHPQKGFHSCVQQCLTFLCGARNSITLNKPRRSEAYTLITGNSISHRDKKTLHYFRSNSVIFIYQIFSLNIDHYLKKTDCCSRFYLCLHKISPQHVCWSLPLIA